MCSKCISLFEVYLVRSVYLCSKCIDTICSLVSVRRFKVYISIRSVSTQSALCSALCVCAIWSLFGTLCVQSALCSALWVCRHSLLSVRRSAQLYSAFGKIVFGVQYSLFGKVVSVRRCVCVCVCVCACVCVCVCVCDFFISSAGHRHLQ
jgi:hypothetical protein